MSNNISNNFRPIYILGDNHGRYDSLFHYLDQFDIKNCHLIHVGDGGEGFLPVEKQERQFVHLNNNFKSRNINYLSIRGNHSDPAYFDGSVNLSNFRLLPDYHYEMFNGELFLFVGGATSIDRKVRNLGTTYWENELFVLKPELIRPCNILISHSAPKWIGPYDKNGIKYWCDQDPTLWETCVKEREDMDKLVQLSCAEKAYFGHFHESHSSEMYGCKCRILAEMEITEHRLENY